MNRIPETMITIIISLISIILCHFFLPCCCPPGFYDLEPLTTFGLDSDGGQPCSIIRFVFDREYFCCGSNSCNNVSTILLRIPKNLNLIYSWNHFLKNLPS